jgi:hypothetical protein
MALLDAALKKAKTQLEKKRIEISKRGLEYAAFPIRKYAIARELAYSSSASEAVASRNLAKAERLAQLIREQPVNWAQAKERRDFLGENLRGLQGMGYLQTDTQILENPAIPGILRLIDWYAKHQPSRKTEVVERLLAGFPTGPIRSAVYAWDRMNRQNAPNLLKNVGFEDEGVNNASAPQADWDAANAPLHWSVWSALGFAEYSKSEGKTGKGIRISTRKAGVGTDEGVLLQNVNNLNPKQLYLGIVWVKAKEAAFAPNATLTLRFRTDKGWFTGDGKSVTSAATIGTEWEAIVVSSSVPMGATALSFMVGTKYADAIFDEAALFAVPNETPQGD